MGIKKVSLKLPSSAVTIISGVIMLILFVSELQYYLTKEVSSSTPSGCFMSSVRPHDSEKRRIKQSCRQTGQTCSEQYSFCYPAHKKMFPKFYLSQWQFQPVTWFLAVLKTTSGNTSCQTGLMGPITVRRTCVTADSASNSPNFIVFSLIHTNIIPTV